MRLKYFRSSTKGRRISLPSKRRKLSKSEKETNKQVDKVEAVKVLNEKYGMSNIDALLAYDKFFKAHPTGEIKKNEFMEENKVNIIGQNHFKNEAI